MLRWFRQRTELRLIGQQLYDGIVAQARSVAFYRDLRVPDTMEGRFEMITLHLYLVRDRLKGEGGAGQRLGQILLEHLIADMDDALRQIGYDMGVPRRVKKAAAAFGDRSAAYGLALDGDAGNSSTLAVALMIHVYGASDGAEAAAGAGGDGDAKAALLADYMRAARRSLAALPIAEILAGRLEFPATGWPQPTSVPLQS